MTDQEAQALAEISQQDQDAGQFRDAATNVATYYRELCKGGLKRKDALDLTAEMQSVYLCRIFGVEV